MDLSPQSALSPKSPYQYPSNAQPLYAYPSPALSGSQYGSTDSLQGLGLYSCQTSGLTVDNGGSVGHGQPSTATNNWPTAAQQNRSTPGSARSTTNIISAEYDPFAPLNPPTSASYTHDIYSTQPAEDTILPASPIPSGNTSLRSSFSSDTTPEIFAQAGSINSYTPRIKMEEPSDYSAGGESMMLSSPQLSHNLLATSAISYTGSLQTTFYQDQSSMGWPKVEYSNSQHLPSISSLPPPPPCNRRSESVEMCSSESHDQSRASSTIQRTRQPRKLTTKEGANFQCRVKGCGKLFGRSYNFKAHMETHDASREYPFPCPLDDCNKKFVRKTDLQRHHQSVHMKQRNYRCDYCSRYFARKDTLRRHMEDGCSKRFDIETVDFRPQTYSNCEESSLGISSCLENQSRHPPYSSSVRYSPPPSSAGHETHDTPLVSVSAQFLERHEYMAGDGNQDPIWSH